MKNKLLIGVASTIFFLLVIVLLAPRMPLNKVAEVLVHKGPIEPAEAIVVLSGSKNGSRVIAGVHLFHEGLGKLMVFSGEEIYPGFYQHNLMEGFAIKQGVPKNRILTKLLNGEISTWGEGIVILKLLNENNIKSFILVTSTYHTGRAYAVYKKLLSELGYELKFSVYPAEDPRIPIKSWWKTRYGKKIILLEYLKMVNFFFEH